MVDRLLNASEYEQGARTKLPKSVYDYYAGGAEDESSLKRNVDDFRRIRFLPRVLRPVGTVTTAIPWPPSFVSGAGAVGESHSHMNTSAAMAHFLDMPVIVAPMAMQRLAHPDGELGVARASKKAGIAYCLSTLSTTSMETVAEVGGVRLFQLYVYKARQETLKLVRRAKASGYTVLVLTVDTPTLGRRERDMRNGFTLPAGMRLGNFEDDDDASSLAGHAVVGASALQRYGDGYLDRELKWEDVSWLVKVSGMAVWVKGIVRADDALQAIAHGASGIVVSNHGGRQLDGTIATIRALPDIAGAVRGRVPVVLDSGVRRGADVVRAIALGASAVMIGRPVLWALAVAGEEGVRHLLEMLKEEITLTMRLLGARNVGEVTRDLVRVDVDDRDDGWPISKQGRSGVGDNGKCDERTGGHCVKCDCFNDHVQVAKL